MKNRKSLMIVALTCAIALVLAACGGTTAPAGTGEDTGNLVIAYSAQSLANTYFVEIVRGIESRAAELGIEVLIHDGNADAAAQVTAFENWIIQGVDAILCSPVDPVALEPHVVAAQAAGIPVIATNQDIAGRDTFIVVPEYEYGLVIGQAAGRWIRDELGGQAQVLVLDFPEIEAIIARANGMVAGILEYAPDAEIVSQLSANNPARGMAAMESALAANPGINVVIGVNDAGALGAYEAMMASGMVDAELMFFGGLDATPEALDAIRRGGIYRATVDIAPYESGRMFVDIAIRTIEEGPIPYDIEIPMILVTVANIEEYF